MERYNRPSRIIRQDEAEQRLGLKRTAFLMNYVQTGKLKKIKITNQAIGFLEFDVERLIAELASQAKGD